MKLERILAIVSLVSMAGFAMNGCANTESVVSEGAVTDADENGSGSGGSGENGSGSGGSGENGSGSGGSGENGSGSGGNGSGSGGNGSGSGGSGGNGSGSGGSGENGSGSGGNGSGSGGNGSGGGGSGENGSGSGGNGSGENESGNSGSVKCSTNNAGRCTSAGIPQLCVNGTWTDQAACSSGLTCAEGRCVSASSCSSPIVVTLGNKVEQSTAGGEKNRTGVNCKFESLPYTNNEAVIRLDVPETAYYDVNVNFLGGGVGAFYASPACDGEDMVMKDWCGDGTSSDSFRMLMNKGSIYAFVEGTATSAVTFDIAFSKSAQQQYPLCTAAAELENSVGTIMDLSTGEFTDKADTSDGKSQYTINSYLCDSNKSVNVGGGKEIVYPFHIDRPVSLRIELTDIKAKSGTTPPYAAIAVVDCNPEVTKDTTKDRCKGTSGGSETLTLITDTLSAGTYNLVIDGEADKNFTYSLKVTEV